MKNLNSFEINSVAGGVETTTYWCDVESAKDANVVFARFSFAKTATPAQIDEIWTAIKPLIDTKELVEDKATKAKMYKINCYKQTNG